MNQEDRDAMAERLREDARTAREQGAPETADLFEEAAIAIKHGAVGLVIAAEVWGDQEVIDDIVAAGLGERFGIEIDEEEE